MKVLLFGGEIVEALGSEFGYTDDIYVGEQAIDFYYHFHPKGRFETYLEEKRYFEVAAQVEADIIIVCLGADSILNSVSNLELYNKCRKFYEQFKKQCPNSIFVAAQVESRYYSSPTNPDQPRVEEYNKRRNNLNAHLKRLRTKDYLMIIAGKGRLDNKCYFRSDGIRLNSNGLTRYMGNIKETISYVINKDKKFRA